MNDPIHLSKFKKALSSGAEWPLTTREWLAFQLCGGAAYIWAGEAKKELAAYEVVICPPKMTLKLLGSVLGTASIRGLAIRVSALTGFLTAVERRCLETEAARKYAPFVTLPAGHPMAERLNGIFADEGAMTLSTRLAVVQTFADLLEPQLREAGRKDAGTNEGDRDARTRLIHLMNQMPESELAGLSLGEFAQKIHACERHASRLFQDVWGQSFRSFVSDLRLKKACQLLAEGRLKIIDVALESGHGSLAHFNYIFKKQMRLTPTEWRERRSKGPTPNGVGLGRPDGPKSKSTPRSKNGPRSSMPGAVEKSDLLARLQSQATRGQRAPRPQIAPLIAA
jgi:AraC-like DNA-binding protein